jgi:hypothetical protein
VQDLGGRQDDHAKNDLEEVKEVVDKLQPPGIVRFRVSFLGFLAPLGAILLAEGLLRHVC